MMVPAESHLTVLERDARWRGGEVVTEPYEAGWAREAVFFVQTLAATGTGPSTALEVQISPDGMEWTDAGTRIVLPPPGKQAAARITHFGGWLRLAGRFPHGVTARVRVYLHLKA